MLGTLVTTRFLLLYAFVASAVYVHLRGRVRHSLQRQFTDHSTVFAPLNVLMYMASAVPRTPILDPRAFPELNVLRDHWREIRGEAEALLTGGHVRPSEAHRDVAFNTFFHRGWRRFHLKWYDDFLPSAQALCPRTVELLRSVPTVHAALFALLPAGGKLTEHRDPYAGSMRYHLGLITPEHRHLSHLRRRRAVCLARRRGRRLRRDLHPSRREPHRPGPHHPLLRRRAAAPHAGHARAEPVHRELRPARHRQPERADRAHRAGESHLGRRASLPAGPPPREAREPTPVLHGEVRALGGPPLRRLPPPRALGH